MSTDANAALAWPIEVTADAAIGEQLVGRKKTPKSVVTLWTYLEMADGKREPGDLQGSQPELCGTTIPGHVSLPCLRDDTETGFHRDHPEARMHWNNSALAWVCAPFVGDSLSDPRVQVEGTETGVWLITPESGPIPRPRWADLEVDTPIGAPVPGPDLSFHRNTALMHSLGSGPAFDNHEAPMGGDGVYCADIE